jgi:hypothetical protein
VAEIKESGILVDDGGTLGGVANKTIEEIFRLVEEEYGDIDDIFATDPELQKLLVDAFQGKFTPQRFFNAVTLTNWFKSNAESVQKRGFYKRIYEDLTKGLDRKDPNYKENARKVAGDTEYFRGLDSFEAELEKTLTEKGIKYTPGQLSSWAEEIYKNANEKNTNFISRFLNRKITFGADAPAGAAADNIATLREYAADMGLNLERDYKSSLSDWLQRLDRGESVQVFKDLIRDNIAATEGKVTGDLVKRGLTLKEIYQPYKTLMASTLEISPEEIQLNDPLLRSAISQDGQLNLFDWKKRLRTDKRWEFTETAREDVYANTYKILKDFGFTG